MKKRTLAVLLAAIMVAGCVLTGCGSKKEEAAAPAAEEKEEEAEEAEPAEEEAEEEAGVQAPVIKDLADYDTIISQLTSGQAYAFADMDEKNDALLVTSGTFDNQDDNHTIAAIDATIYGFDKDGNIIEYGPVQSEGTAYPLAIYEGCLMFGGNHHMGMQFINEEYSSIMTKEDATEVFDSNGKATYYWFSLDEEFEGEVEDDSKLQALYDKYNQAIVINFTVVE